MSGDRDDGCLSCVSSQTAVVVGEGASFASSASTSRMAVSIGDRPGRETTRALLAGIVRGERGAQLRAAVARWNPGATTDQVEEAFQEACARADRCCHGQSEGEVYVWLRTTAHRELGRLRQRAWREVPVDATAGDFDHMRADVIGPVEELIEREDQAELEQATRQILSRLSDRDRAIAALHTRGLRRQQIAECLGVTPRIVKRSLEQILATGRHELVQLAGHGCNDGEGLVARLAFGLAAPREARRAQLHLTSCGRCGAMYERLDLWREKVAAILPMPAAAEAHSHVVERVIHASADALSVSRGGSSSGPTGVRRHASEAFSHVRDHAAAAYYRVVDPTPLAGVRPGAVAATVAGCLVVGGGTTYCVQQGIDPVASLTSIGRHERHNHDVVRHKKRVETAQASPSPTVVAAVTTPPPQPTQQPTPQPTPQPTSAPPVPTATAIPTTTPTVAPAPQDEYEPTSVTASSASTVRATSSHASKPAPAPADGPGEFGGP